MLLVFDRSGFMTLATGDMKRTKRSGPRTEPDDGRRKEGWLSCS